VGAAGGPVAATEVTFAPGARTGTPDDGMEGSSMSGPQRREWSDADRVRESRACIGCLQCELACAVEHSASQDAATAFLEVPVPRKRVHVEPGPMPTLAFPNAAALRSGSVPAGLPVRAITREDELGVVLVEPKRCIGCAMSLWSAHST